jgi:hypothetical protein
MKAIPATIVFHAPNSQGFSVNYGFPLANVKKNSNLVLPFFIVPNLPQRPIFKIHLDLT